MCGYFPRKQEEVMVPRDAETDSQAFPVCTSWGDVGNEIRQAMYDLVHRFREEINKK